MSVGAGGRGGSRRLVRVITWGKRRSSEIPAMGNIRVSKEEGGSRRM